MGGFISALEPLKIMFASKWKAAPLSGHLMGWLVVTLSIG